MIGTVKVFFAPVVQGVETCCTFAIIRSEAPQPLVKRYVTFLLVKKLAEN